MSSDLKKKLKDAYDIEAKNKRRTIFEETREVKINPPWRCLSRQDRIRKILDYTKGKHLRVSEENITDWVFTDIKYTDGIVTELKVATKEWKDMV